MRVIAIIAALVALPAIAAEPITGKVVGVYDGDTITVLVDGNRQVKVRLHGVDCPERGQAFGNRAKQFTSDQCFGQTVTIRGSGTDKYGRTIGEVITANGTNVNVALVEHGLGWWYEKYAPGDARFRDAQQKASAATRGLWTDPGVIPPWEYRSHNRNEKSGGATGMRQALPKDAAVRDGGHWLTTSSNKRHNLGCKMYRNTNGRHCGPDEGTPCKICGG